MEYRNIEIENRAGYLETTNLDLYIKCNIRLKHFDNYEGEFNLMRFFVDYILGNQPNVKDQETISYGLWLLRFVQVKNSFEIFELNESFTDWVEGAESAIYYLELQRKTCEEENAQFHIPLFTQKIAISKGVLEGDNLQGIRYAEPTHMTGWYLTTSEYDGNIKNMQVVDLQLLVINRKDLLQFLALPPGFVFETLDNNKCRIWKHSEITQNISGN